MIEGIPAEAFDFYDALRADNSKAFWAAHKADYDAYVRAPLQALVDALADEFGQAHLFRPYRDVRFSKDKAPYKDHQGAFAAVGDAVGYYVQVSSAGLMIAGGWYSPQGQQLARYREAVDGPAGAELERIVRCGRAQGARGRRRRDEDPAAGGRPRPPAARAAAAPLGDRHSDGGAGGVDGVRRGGAPGAQGLARHAPARRVAGRPRRPRRG